jgi:hypothetical protein
VGAVGADTLKRTTYSRKPFALQSQPTKVPPHSTPPIHCTLARVEVRQVIRWEAEVKSPFAF